MKILNILVVLLAVSLYRCSSGDVEKEKGEKELVSEVEQSLNEQPASVTPEEDLFFDEKSEVEVTEVAAPEVVEEVVTEAPAEQPKMEEIKPETNVKITEAGEYIVEKGDTLLLISFKIYGDYRKWRQILAENPGVSTNNLTAGKILRYTQTENPFEWIKRGNAHLILKGDTLGTISNQYYGTNRRWKEIYKNNQPMILDPNLIFAGFTLYYVPDKMASN